MEINNNVDKYTTTPMVEIRWLLYGTVSFLACACYWNSLWGDFVHDDVLAVVKNPDVDLDTSWWDIWSHDYWGEDITLNTSHKSYRPVTVLTFR